LSVVRTSVLLVEITAALTDPAGVELWRLTERELLALVTELSVARNAVDALVLRAVAEVEQRGSARAVGASSTAGWLAEATRTAPGTAVRTVELAAALTGAPAVAEVLGTGLISTDHAQVITSTLGGLPADLPDAGRDACREFLLDAAHTDTPPMLRRRGTDLIHRLRAESLEERENSAVARRELHIGTVAFEGLVPVRGWLDVEAAELAKTVLSPLSAPHPAEDGQRDRRSGAQRMADALVELLHLAGDHACIPGEGYTRPHLTLTVDATTLAAGHGPTPQLSFLGPLSVAAARRIACDAELTVMSLDANLVPLDVGRCTYLVTGGLRTALTARDRGCAFTGCGRPPGWCHAHHIQHWADGGSTALPNLVLLCGHHHRLIHHGGWVVSLGEDQHPRFTPPPWVDPTQTPRPAHTRRPAPPLPAVA